MCVSINPKHLSKTSQWASITLIVMPMQSSHSSRHSLPRASVVIAHSYAGIACMKRSSDCLALETIMPTKEL